MRFSNKERFALLPVKRLEHLRHGFHLGVLEVGQALDDVVGAEAALTVALGKPAEALVQRRAATQDQELEQIIVTGSRIPQANLEGTSPVSVIGAQDVQLEGRMQVEDLINNLPQAFADQGGNVSNGASGTATVNLRNLGPDRTLVLVNGRRLPAGSPRGPVAPDLNQIPTSLIERVEVLTGGASAVPCRRGIRGAASTGRDTASPISFSGRLPPT